MQQLVDGTLQVGRAVSFVTEQDDVGTDTDAVPARPACQCVGASWATARQYPILCAATSPRWVSSEETRQEQPHETIRQNDRKTAPHRSTNQLPEDLATASTTLKYNRNRNDKHVKAQFINHNIENNNNNNNNNDNQFNNINDYDEKET